MRRSAWSSKRETPDMTAGELSARNVTRPLTHAALLLGLIAAAVGAGHLAAWLGGRMSQRGLSTITMKANTALCLTLVGTALILLVPAEVGRLRRWVARVLAAAALLIGLLTFMENVSGWNFGIDQFLAAETPGAMAVASPNQMGVPASLSFTLIGLALLILSRRDHRRVWTAQALALAVCLVGLLPIIGFLYGAQEFYGIARYTGIAWHTAVVLWLGGLGLLCARPAEGLMAQVTASDPGGVSLRRLLPLLIILPLPLGWLRLAGEHAGLFDAATGTAMTMLLFIVIFSALAYHAGRRASRAAKVLHEGQERLRFALETSRTGAWDLDLVDHTVHRSLEHDRIFGYEQLLPQWTYEMFLEHVVPEDRALVDAKFRQATTACSDWSFECRIRRADGELRWIWAAGRHREDASGVPRRMAGIVQDITERKQAQEALQWSARRDEMLSQTAARLLQSDNPQGLVEELCRQVMDFLDCHAFFNFLVDPPSGRLRLNACAGIPAQEARKIEWLDYGVAVCGCVARDGCRIIAEDIPHTADPRTTLVRSYGIQAYCCHPLTVQDRLIGTLSFGTRARPHFRPEEIEVMKAVTDLVAMAVHRIEIEQALRELNTTLEARVGQRTAELARRTKQLQKLTLELAQAEERERRRIAVILHEDLQQQIAGARFHLNVVRSVAPNDRQRAYVDKVDALLAETIEQSRHLSYDLSPAVVHMNDLAEVLAWLAHRVREQHGLVVRLEMSSDMVLRSEALA
ncbi:MAG: PAS domain-containing protein, partial [Planctomycetes bacterium]|nr:PAS domain-containing protein [Planctomycetota bacterium]